MKKSIFQLVVEGSDKAIKDLAALELEIDQINKNLREAKKVGNEDLYKNLKVQQEGLKKEISATRKEINRQVKDFQKAEFPTDSLIGLQRAYGELSQEIRGLSQADPQFEQKVAEARKLKDQIREVSIAFGDTSPNIGNYSASILDAFSKQQKLAKQLDQVKERFNQLPKSIKNSTAAQKEYSQEVEKLEQEINKLGEITGKSAKDLENGFIEKLEDSEGALGDATKGVRGLGKSFKALLANPVVAVFAALAAAVTAVFTAFTKTERGANLMAKATGFLNGIMSVFVGFVDDAVTALIKFSEDPLQGIQNLGKAIIENVQNRITAAIDLFGIAGKALQKLFTGDFAGLTEVAGEAQVALQQFATGLDAEQQQEFAKAIQNTVEKVKEETNAFVALEAARRNVRKQNRGLTKDLEELTTVQELQQAIADDTTKSFAEREAAAEKARQALEGAAQKEIQLAQNQLSLLNTEIALRAKNGEDVEDLKDQQIDALSAVMQAERNLTLAIADNERTRAALKQDRLERDLDILIDGFDNQKNINERIIEDDKRTITERTALFDETVKLSEDSFNKQIETIQQFTGVAIDSNSLLQESDAVALNERIRALGLSETIEGRLLEVIRDRRTAVQDLEEIQQALNEATAAQKVTDIETNRSVQLTNVINDDDLSDEDRAQKIADIEFETSKKILEQQLKNAKISVDEKAKLEEELAVLKRDRAESLEDQLLQDALNAVELERVARKKAAFEEVADAEERARLLEQIDLEAEQQINAKKRMLQDLSILEREQLELESIERKKNADIAAEEEKQQKKKEIAEQSVKATTDVLNAVQKFQDAKTKEELKALDKEYAARIEAAEGNSEEQARLQEELEAKKEAIEREAFERNKKFQVAQTLIASATAVVQALAQLGPIAGGIAAVAIAVKTAFQIAAINAQTYAEGGLLSGRKHQAAHRSDSGIRYLDGANGRVIELEGGEGVLKGAAVASDRVFSLTGTPQEIGSSLNQLFGGDSWGGANAAIHKVPMLHNPNNFIVRNNTAQFSDEQLQHLADMLTGRLATLPAAIAQSNEKGIEKGIIKAELEKQRRFQRNKKMKL